MHNFLLLSPEVAAARTAGKPIVALESTIISHGMPYPQNVRTAREVEQIIRDAGAVPATIAVIAGKICIGLSDEQLELLGSSPDAMKVSRRDLAYVLAQARLGATTVAATMICAQLAGIEVFVTGNELRYFGRPAGTGADQRGGRLRRRQIDPRHWPDT
jgi:pseudouridine-5'-phosphate glycosidase